MNNLLIVEPHPDDALLSLLNAIELLQSKDWKIHLVSTFWTEKRNSEAFCIDFGIKYVKIESEQEIMFFDRMPKSFFGELKNYQKDIKNFYLKKHMDKWSKVQMNLSNLTWKDWDLVLVPFGIYHPWHVITSSVCGVVFHNCEKLLYAEIPYRCRNYGKRTIQDSGAKLFSTFASLGKKDSLLLKYYPSEKGVLRFDRENVVKTPETLYEGWSADLQ